MRDFEIIYMNRRIGEFGGHGAMPFKMCEERANTLAGSERTVFWYICYGQNANRLIKVLDEYAQF
jgi:hypothetical protein